MRVISGKLKGQKLKFFKNKDIRPTADMVKEAIFAKLFDKVENAVILDAFCGSGQIGIEALSRGAKKVYFVDSALISIKTVKENLKNLELVKQSEIFHMTILKALTHFKQAFDIIFLDPPYDYKDYNQVLKLIKEQNLLDKKGIIVCEHSSKLELFFEGFEKFSTKTYGAKAISYFKKD